MWSHGGRHHHRRRIHNHRPLAGRRHHHAAAGGRHRWRRFLEYFIALNGQDYPSLAAAKQAGALTINFGLFINNVISFTIVAFVLFMAVKGMNRLRRKQEEEEPQTEPPPSREVQLLEEIRDELVKRG